MEQEGAHGRPRLRDKGDGWRFWLWLCLSPLLLVLSMELITRMSPTGVFQWIGREPPAFVLSYLAVWCLMFLGAVGTGRLWLGILLPAVPAMILCVVNYLKLSVNGIGLVVSDMALAGNAGTLMEFIPPKLHFPVWGVIAVILLAAAAVATGMLVKELPAYLQGKRRRGIAALAAAAVVALALFTPWFYYVGARGETQAERDDRLGLLLGLYGGVLRAGSKPLNAPPVDLEPADPSNIIETIGVEISKAPSFPDLTPKVEIEEKPTVIMLMSESFCDPDVVLPGVEFETDPIANYHAISGSCPSGVFLTNSYAGGTGNVEMEVFTGIPAGLVAERDTLTTLSAEGAYSNAPSIVKTFGEAGYHTKLIHTYNDQLYNRRTNLAEIGFESMMFADDFPDDAPVAGPYLSDMALTNAVIETLEEKKDGEALFLYALSMGNHQPIFAGKYDQPSGLGTACELLDEEDLGSVDALAQGLHGADEALGALVEYLAGCDHPVILVFWGDHLPGMYVTPDHSVFSALGYVSTADIAKWDAETVKRMYSTNYFVWNNYGARLKAPGEVGAMQLGGLTLEWAGVEKPAYFQWVDMSRENLREYHGSLYVDGTGTPSLTVPEENEGLLNTYRQFLYDVLYPKDAQEWSAGLTDYAALGW